MAVGCPSRRSKFVRFSSKRESTANLHGREGQSIDSGRQTHNTASQAFAGGTQSKGVASGIGDRAGGGAELTGAFIWDVTVEKIHNRI